MCTRKRFLTGSEQIGKGFRRELELENRRESGNGPGMDRRARNDVPVREGAGSRE